jgi:cobalt-zinc-cadmium efflux system outer membrane protein
MESFIDVQNETLQGPEKPVRHRMRPVRRILLCIAVWASCTRCPAADPADDALRVQAGRLETGGPRTIAMDPRKGIGPEEAAVVAVLMSPALKAIRDKGGAATAELIQAGVLPNPQLSYERDAVSGGDLQGTQNGFSSSATWEITSLLPLLPRRAAARLNARAVDLDVAWEEWQAAANAKLAVYHVAALQKELAAARDADAALRETVMTLRKAVAANEKTVLELAAGESSSEDAHATVLEVAQDLDKQWLVLKRAMGLEPDTDLRLRPGILLPSRLPVPDEAALSAQVESRRIDLIGLRQGCLSQDETVRAAVLAAFPKITAGFARNTDTTDVHTQGFTVQVELPLFDRNQGNVATERTTRQTLKDEYAQRAFEARNDIASAVADIRWLDAEIAAAEEALPLLEKLTTVAQTASESGNADVLGYYDARSNLVQKRLQLIKLEEELMETKTALELASGQMDPQ